MGIYLNPGNAAFSEAVHSQIYVDKTELISYTNNVLATNQKNICVSRPRRFGKSITANMLAAYYSKGCQSDTLFKDRKISCSKDYKKYLELIQYDILFGEDYYLSEDEKTTSSNLKMGTKDIKIKSATVQGNQICIKGKNFTRKSVVFINGKEENTLYVNKNTLRVYYDKDDIDNIDDIVVKQIGLHNISLSQTNSIKLSN